MSSPAAGNFDCARLQEIKVRLDALIDPNDVKNAEYIPDIAPLTMLKAIQTAKFPDLEDPAKVNTYKSVWLDDCDDSQPENCSESCLIDGEEIGTQCKNFELETCFHKSFSVLERKFELLGNTVSMDEEIAVNLAKKIKLMDEEWARRVVSTLDSMAGVNLNGSPYTVAGDTTTIPATAWNPDLFGYFAVTKNRNKMSNMRLLLGGLMEQYFWKIGMETGTPEGQANARKVASLGTVYNDSFVTEEVLGQKTAFLIAPSALAIVNRARYSRYGAGREEVSQGHKTIYYTIRSRNSGIVYDVIYQLQCVDNGDLQDWKHIWDITSRGDVLTSPMFCNPNRTGVLKFVCE